MEYYRSPADCPNRDKLAKMTLQQAAEWALHSPSHCTEISRRAQIMAFYRLTSYQELAAFQAAIDGIECEPVTFASELTPIGEQLVIPGCERNLAPAAKQLSLFG